MKIFKMNIPLEVHKLFNAQKRYHFPFAGFKSEIYSNGIYIIFEAGEKYENLDRIVRVGTHTGPNQLFSRLNQHFLIENKNRSIFRKNIGRCILNKDNHPYLPFWELDITSKQEKENNLRKINIEFERKLEKQISNYIQGNLSFCIFKVDEKSDRLSWESKIVSTLAKARDIKPSKQWLGNYSPKEKIKASGLWQVNELYKESLNEFEFRELRLNIS
jgi:hypothetical protein